MTHLEFLARAVTASPNEREQLWSEVRNHGETEDAVLRVAVMQSLQGHSGHAPGSAHKTLGGLLAGTESKEVAAVAAIRLEALKESTACAARIRGLEERLSRIADIERALDRGSD